MVLIVAATIAVMAFAVVIVSMVFQAVDLFIVFCFWRALVRFKREWSIADPPGFLEYVEKLQTTTRRF